MKRIIYFGQCYWFAGTLFILLAITALSLWPGTNLPSVPGTDKIHHLIAYALLVMPVALRKPKNWLFFCLLFILFSGVIELVQPFVNRYSEWKDLLANSLGVCCGLVVAKMIKFAMNARKIRTAAG